MIGEGYLQWRDQRSHEHFRLDDIISFCDDDELYAEYAAAFFGKFKGTDFGTDLHEWNSMRITQKPGEVKLDMQRYIEDVITDAFPGGIHHKYVSRRRSRTSTRWSTRRPCRRTRHTPTPRSPSATGGWSCSCSTAPR